MARNSFKKAGLALDYLSLYRKWRPQRFDQGFVGQEHLVRTITNATIQDKVAHAYLFNGPRGTGKTTAAKILAKSLNCIKRGTDPNPCNDCPNCEKINAGVSLDVLEIDGASNRGIDEVRDLREKIKFAPVEGEYKVYIIDEVHMLTTEAFNALLKTLEEPPSHIIFIFATTEAHKVPATILSRCQRFDFKPLTPEEIFKHLNFISQEEQFTVEPAALQIIARESGGGLRDAIGLLEQSMAHADGNLTVTDAQAILGLIETEILFALAQAVAEEDIQSGLGLINQVLENGKDLQLFARQTARFFRDLIVLLIVGEQAPVTLDAEWKGKGSEVAGRIGLEPLKKGVDLFLEAGMGLKRGIEGTLPLEMALIQLIISQRETQFDSASADSSPINTVDSGSLGVIKVIQDRLAALERKVSLIQVKKETSQGVKQDSLLPEPEKQSASRQTTAKVKMPGKSETASSGEVQKADSS